MVSSVKKIMTVVLVLGTLGTSFIATASNNSEVKYATSGVIHFTGAIVAPPCTTQVIENNVETKCWQDNGKEKTVSVNVNKLKNKDIALPNLKGTQKFSWIDKNNKLGIYTVVYD